MTNKISIISININGLEKKIRQIIELIHQYKTDFIFLQETYVDTDFKAHKYLTQLGLQHACFSLARYAGVGILQTSDSWDIIQQNTDSEGRIAIIQVESRNDRNPEKHTLVNVSAPALRIKQPFFFENLTDTLSQRCKHQKLIVGGDFNCVLNNLDLTRGTVDTRTRENNREQTQSYILQNIGTY
jgi:exonuclease III